MKVVTVMMWDGSAGAFMLVWLLFGFALLLLTVVGVVWLVRSVSSDGGGSRPPASGPMSAREELDRRYARGEIGPEEYRQVRDDLEGGPS